MNKYNNESNEIIESNNQSNKCLKSNKEKETYIDWNVWMKGKLESIIKLEMKEL